MNLKKISALTLALFFAAGVFLTPAFAESLDSLDINMQNFATESNNTIAPRWDNISSIHPVLSASGNTLYADVSVVAENSNGSITGTMYLEEEVGVDDWDSVKSWSIQGTGYASREGTYSGDSGSTYRIRAKIFIGGESATAYSNEVTL